MPVTLLHAGDVEVQLPTAHQEHSASLGRASAVNMWPGQRLHRLVHHMQTKPVGDAQPHTGAHGERICMCPDHQHDQDHGVCHSTHIATSQ